VENRSLAFGPFRLDTRQRILEREGEVIPLTPKAIDTLILLVESAGEVVDKNTIMQHLWPDTFVVESTLTRNISVLRKALGCRGQYIETFSKRGYRFVAPVNPVRPAPASPVSSRRTFRPVAIAAVIMLAGIVHFPSSAPAARFDGSPEARRLALIAAYHWHKLTATDLHKAKTHYQAAVKTDPRSASAWAGLADTYVTLVQLGGGPVSILLPKASDAARRAIELNPKLAAPHSALALTLLLTQFDWRRAEEEYKISLRIDPSHLPAYCGYSRLLMSLRRFDEAERLIRRGMERDPASPLLAFHEGQLHYMAERYEWAAALLSEVIEREPGYEVARYYLALSYGYLGRYEEALRELRASGRHANLQETEEAWILARSGRKERAEMLLARRREQVNRREASPIVLPVLAVAAGRLDEAVAALESCVAVRSIELLALLSEPRFAPLRGNPRFAALAARIHSVT
jgi:DNA-binding winged helix-turn-helix (wHTH) protein/Tfp pilus assembly protein PilF